MLKTTRLSDKLAFGRNDGNGVVVGFGGDEEPAKKSEKSKGQKLSKSQKSAKSRKKSSKSGNLPKFDAKEARSTFLTFDIRKPFNCLQLAFTKALIL